jgi:UDP-glucose 4-epimerase
MGTFFVSGGSGFFGGILKRKLLDLGHRVINFDLIADPDKHERLTSVKGDLRNAALVDRVFAEHHFDGVFHIAAVLAHGKHVDDAMLWESNVDGTRNVAIACRNHGVKNLVFTSTNCLWARNFGRPVREDDGPEPIEIYGRSKAAAEQVLSEFPDLKVVTIRCPTIIDSGRLGLLAILFEFIREGRKVWVVGDGSNRYQFIYAPDLADACVSAMAYEKSNLFHIGSDHVNTLQGVYEAVISKAGTKARVGHLPKGPTLAAMQLAYKLNVSPLGPYHYKMIAEDFIFDTTRIKQELGWKPTLTNEGMLTLAYEYYDKNLEEIQARTDVSAHNKAADMGIIRVLKWIS